MSFHACCQAASHGLQCLFISSSQLALNVHLQEFEYPLQPWLYVLCVTEWHGGACEVAGIVCTVTDLSERS